MLTVVKQGCDSKLALTFSFLAGHAGNCNICQNGEADQLGPELPSGLHRSLGEQASFGSSTLAICLPHPLSHRAQLPPSQAFTCSGMLHHLLGAHLQQCALSADCCHEEGRLQGCSRAHHAETGCGQLDSPRTRSQAVMHVCVCRRAKATR